MLITQDEFLKLRQKIKELEDQQLERANLFKKPEFDSNHRTDDGLFGEDDGTTASMILRNLLNLKEKAEIVPIQEQNEIIEMGCGVVLKFLDNNETFRGIFSGFLIDTDDPSSSYKISYQSPIGKALHGKKAGETTKVDIMGRKREIIIEQITLPSKINTILG